MRRHSLGNVIQAIGCWDHSRSHNKTHGNVCEDLLFTCLPQTWGWGESMWASSCNSHRASVSCLMPATALPRRYRQFYFTVAFRDMPVTFLFQLYGIIDTKEVKYRNAHLSHFWYSYVIPQRINRTGSSNLVYSFKHGKPYCDTKNVILCVCSCLTLLSDDVFRNSSQQLFDVEVSFLAHRLTTTYTSILI